MKRVQLLVVLCAVGLAAVGCKSEGEKLYEEGKEFANRGMDAQALTKFQEAATKLKAEGNEPGRAYEKLAGLYKKQQNLPEAIKYYRMAIDDKPKDFDRHAKLISALSQNHQFAEAREAYDKISADPDLRYELKSKRRLEEAKERIDFEETAWKDAQAAATAGAGGGAAPPAAAPPATGDAPANSDAAAAPAVDASAGEGNA